MVQPACLNFYIVCLLSLSLSLFFTVDALMSMVIFFLSEEKEIILSSSDSSDFFFLYLLF